MQTLFVSSFDQNYFYVAAVAVISLGRNTNIDLDVICLVPDSLKSREQEFKSIVAQPHLNIKFRTYDKFSEVEARGLDSDLGYLTASCNHRLYMSSVCFEYDRAFYFDPDTLFLRDIDPILNFPLRNNFMAVVEYSNSQYILHGTRDIPYFNNGVFLTSLEFWRSNGIEQKFIDWQTEHGMTTYPEQDTMNDVLIDYWSPLPVSFNTYHWQLLHDPVFYDDNSDPLIIHFAGPKSKPWVEDVSKWTSLWLDIFDSIPRTTNDLPNNSITIGPIL